jgi:hypothetical protein
MKMTSKILILSVLTFFLLAGSALAISLPGNLLQNYFDTISFGLKYVDYQIMPLDYSLVGEELAVNYDINYVPENKVIDTSDDETIITQWSNYQILYFATRAIVSNVNRVAEDADSCIFVVDFVELSIVPSVPGNPIASLPEPATIVLMGFGLFGLGGWARRLQKTRV